MRFLDAGWVKRQQAANVHHKPQIHQLNPLTHIRTHTHFSPFVQVLTLAGPAVLVSTAILGVAVKYALPYGWDWPTALMVGSMLW